MASSSLSLSPPERTTVFPFPGSSKSKHCADSCYSKPLWFFDLPSSLLHMDHYPVIPRPIIRQSSSFSDVGSGIPLPPPSPCGPFAPFQTPLSLFLFHSSNVRFPAVSLPFLAAKLPFPTTPVKDTAPSPCGKLSCLPFPLWNNTLPP